MIKIPSGIHQKGTVKTFGAVTQEAMVKLLISGSINSMWETLFGRINSLQNSPHGPFDCLLVVGKAFADQEEFNRVSMIYEFTIPTFFLADKSIEVKNLPNNVSFIPIASAFSMLSLRVFFLPSSFCVNENFEFTKDNDYSGCDILVSSEWPLGLHNFLNDG